MITSRVVYVKIHHIYFPGGIELPPGSRNICIQTVPGGDGAISPLNGTTSLTSSTIWIFRFKDPADTYLSFIISELINGQQKEVSRLALPLTWFTVNAVVRSSYPMLTQTPQNGAPFAYLDIHLCDDDAPAFTAPFGPLLVVPNWAPPIEPPIQPVSVISDIPLGPPSHGSNFVTAGCFQSVSPNETPAFPPPLSESSDDDEPQYPSVIMTSLDSTVRFDENGNITPSMFQSIVPSQH